MCQGELVYQKGLCKLDYKIQIGLATEKKTNNDLYLIVSSDYFIHFVIRS